jgi:hypothetical protein
VTSRLSRGRSVRERFHLRVAGDLCVLDQRVGAQRLSFGGDPVPHLLVVFAARSRAGVLRLNCTVGRSGRKVKGR